MEETKQERKVKKVYDELLNLDEIKEKFIHFYGEKYRTKIENLFKLTDFVIIPKFMETYELSKNIHKNFPQLERYDIENVIEFLNIADFAIFEGQQEDFVNLIQSPILQSLGINFNEYIIETDGQYSWKSEELKNNFLKIYNEIIGECSIGQLAREYDTRRAEPYTKDMAKMYDSALTEDQKAFVTELIEKIAKSYGGDLDKASLIYWGARNSLSDPNDLGAFVAKGEAGKDRLQYALPLGDISLDTIIHEIGHLVQTHIMKDVVFEDKGYYETGFSDGFDANVSFNEMINEYLTERIMEEEFEEYDSSVRKKSNCAYSQNVRLFDKFLRKYESVLKDMAIGRNPLYQIDKILGYENYKKIAYIVNMYGKADEGKYLEELSRALDKPITSIEDVLKYANEINQLEISGCLKKYVDVVQQADQMCELLIEHFDELTKSSEDVVRPDLTKELTNKENLELSNREFEEELALKYEE